jgi:hypothetical protein
MANIRWNTEEVDHSELYTEEEVKECWLRKNEAREETNEQKRIKIEKVCCNLFLYSFLISIVCGHGQSVGSLLQSVRFILW